MELLILAEGLSGAAWAGIGGGVTVAAAAAYFAFAKKPKPVEKMSFETPADRLRYALGKSRSGVLDRIRSVFSRKVDVDAIGALEEILLAADIGVKTTDKLVTELQDAFKRGEIKDQDELLANLQKRLKERMGGDVPKLNKNPNGPTVILMVGVNGVGKTTSISKLAKHLAENGHKVLLGASDTFRAAAIDQLETWADRLDLEIVKGEPGGKPDAVAHDTADKALTKNFDYAIVDTAGRLHTDKRLMDELGKISRVLGKKIEGAPHETLLVLDATTGQNGVRQAVEFQAKVPVSGIFLSKLDGTAKGGIVVAINEELDVPVKFVGLGESADDVAPFDAETFVNALLS